LLEDLPHQQPREMLFELGLDVCAETSSNCRDGGFPGPKPRHLRPTTVRLKNDLTLPGDCLVIELGCHLDGVIGAFGELM